MIRRDLKTLLRLEEMYPGFIPSALSIESTDLPRCPHCDSPDTAKIHCGLVEFSMNLGGVCSKMHLLPNYNGLGIYFCNNCKKQFGPLEFDPY
ncbi:MAG: hypothetical protein AAGU04_06780 [Anaerolineaceae bacterium]